MTSLSIPSTDTATCGATRRTYRAPAATDAARGRSWRIVHRSDTGGYVCIRGVRARKLADQSRTWLSDAIDKLQEISRLADGWDGYSAARPTGIALRNARDLIVAIHRSGMQASRIAASVANGIGITLRTGRRKAYIELYNDGQAYAMLSEAGHAVSVTPIRPGTHRYNKILEDIREHLGG